MKQVLERCAVDLTASAGIGLSMRYWFLLMREISENLRVSRRLWDRLARHINSLDP
jgi:hypothetical protein